MTRTASPVAQSNLSRTLADGRLGVPAVVFFVLSAAAPLTVTAGVIPTGYAVTGVTGIPLAFLVVAVVLALFSVGYVAMARHVANAGAFYAYIARGLGRPAGVGAAWVALLAYNLLQVGLYGAVGAAATPLLDQWLGIAPPWWGSAVLAWALVAVLGVLRVDVNGTVLAVLLVAEVGVVGLYAAANLAHPAGGVVTVDTLAPGNLLVPGVGAILALAVLGFVGFESAVVFSEESRNPRRTVPTATYLSVVLIAVMYALASWAMTVATGPDRVVTAAAEQGPELVFNLAAGQLGQPFADIGHALFLTSLLAAMISFHNTTARYMFALGREQVLPAALGRTSRRTGAPKVGSLVQSAIGLAVIVTYAVAGWDPLVQLFFWCGTSGGIGVLLLVAATSVAVVAFFAHCPAGLPLSRRLVAPALAAGALGVVVTLAVANIDTLLGVSPDSPLRWVVPGGYLAAALVGVGWGLALRSARPEVYATIGLGAKSAVLRVPARPASPAEKPAVGR
ncbi:MAG TPA: APC family permease [Micromonosporaceae bacterium]|nr:APC family permease [Micromonosporaceae bacterium]